MELDLVKYVKTLVPNIDKEQIIEDLRVTEAEMQTIVIPAFASAASFFSKDKFKSKEANDLNNRIQSITKGNGFVKMPTFIGNFHQRLTMIEKNLGILTKAVEKEIGRDVITDGVSSRKVMLIRIAEKFSYISRRSIDLLNLVYVYESSAAGTDSRGLSMSKAEVARTVSCVENLARLIEGYGVDSRDFEKNLEKTPDIILSRSGNQEVEAMYTDKDMDPMSWSGLVGFVGNPIYHIRMVIAEWQVNRYKAAQETKKVLELRLLHLKIQQEQQGSNPKLEQEIEYTQARVSKLNKRLQEDEADLDIVN